jgi:hypothetical protein
MTVSVSENHFEQQLEFYVIKDSTTISDSIFIFTREEPQLVSDSIFETFFLPFQLFVSKKHDYGFVPKEKPLFISNWSVILIITIFLLIAAMRSNLEKYLTQIFDSLFNKKTLLRLYREKFSTENQSTFILDLFFYVAEGLFVYQAAHYIIRFEPGISLLFFLAITLGLALFIGIKYFFYRFSGHVFNANSEAQEYIFYTKTGNRALGLLLFPLSILLFFTEGRISEFLLFLGGLIILVISIVSIGRGIRIVGQKVFSVYYLILYLCTLEILPLLVVWRILVSN